MTRGYGEKRPLDYEMLILVPIMFTLLLANVTSLVMTWHSGGADFLSLVQTVLTTGFFVLLVVLLLIRRPAKPTKGSWWATIAAYGGTFLPFALILNDAPALDVRLLIMTSIALMLVGLTFSLYALLWLGRSFGVVPAARQLVRGGPYGIVRHPLYVAEIVTFAGVVLGQLTLFSVAVFLTLTTVQVYRAMEEEKVLMQAFPDYGAYRQRTRRFIPGVI